ncbi:MAG: protein kinase [bacterium]|nr:protein kinase [bacterium]
MARILVSDDDPQVLRIVSRILEHAGHEVTRTEDPLTVVPLAKKSRFDAIILDVMTTPVSGFEILGALRSTATTSSVPVLLLSGRAISGADRVRGLREGADDYLVKPFEPEELELRVENLVAWRARTEAGGEEDGQGADAPPSDESCGPCLGRYEVKEVIGQGTMGTVYRGWDPRLQRPVALKTIRLDSIIGESERRAMLSRLRHEAVTVARFNHPNIVAVYDMGDAEDSAFMAMELVDGFSLAHYLSALGALRVGKLIPVGAGIARGLAAAHAREVIHRDVKPSNVLLGRDGGVKVTDFGVAYVVSQVSDESTLLYGTPGYVPPEALEQEPYTQAGDLFGLGATLYEALAGFHPLGGGTLQETIHKTLAGKIAALSEQVPELPDGLEELVTALLSREPRSRPSAESVAEFLDHAAAVDNLRWTAEDLPQDL